jgi:hypothetical protein
MPVPVQILGVNDLDLRQGGSRHSASISICSLMVLNELGQAKNLCVFVVDLRGLLPVDPVEVGDVKSWRLLGSGGGSTVEAEKAANRLVRQWLSR